MKSNLFLILVLLFTLASCGGDDDCLQADWVGTYTGTEDCNGETADATVVVTASGEDNIVFVIETDASTLTFDPLPFDGCNVNQSDDDGTFSLDLSVDLDGNDLTLNTVFSAGSESSVCEYSVTR